MAKPVYALEYVQTYDKGCEHIARMWSALDCPAHEVRAPVPCSAPFGGASVCNPARCCQCCSSDRRRLVQCVLWQCGVAPHDAEPRAAGDGHAKQCPVVTILPLPGGFTINVLSCLVGYSFQQYVGMEPRREVQSQTSFRRVRATDQGAQS